MIPKPYLLFIGEAPDELAIKTASGVYEWRPEWCAAQYAYSEAKFHLDLPIIDFETATAKGIKTMVIGVVNAGGIMSEKWKQTIIKAIQSGLNIASGCTLA